MKLFTIKKDKLTTILQEIITIFNFKSKTVDKKKCDYINLQIIDKVLHCSFDDHELKVVLKTDLEETTSNINFSLNISFIKVIFSYIKDIKDTTIIFETNNNDISNIKELKMIWSNFKYNIPLECIEDNSLFIKYNELSEIKKDISIVEYDLFNALNCVYYAASDNENRKSLNGVLLDIKDDLFFVATDGRRLSISKKNIEKQLNGYYNKIIVPLRTINILNRLTYNKSNKKDIQIGIDSEFIYFSINKHLIIASKFINEIYPDYNQIVPKTFSKKSIINSEKFCSILRYIRDDIQNKQDPYLIMQFNNDKQELTIESKNCSFVGKIDNIQYTGDQDIEIILNQKFISDAMDKIKSSDVVIEMNENNLPIKISDKDDDSFVYIMMPIYIQKDNK